MTNATIHPSQPANQQLSTPFQRMENYVRMQVESGPGLRILIANYHVNQQVFSQVADRGGDAAA